MRTQRKIGMQFSERMSGYFTKGENDFVKGYQNGKEQNSTLCFDVTILVDCVSDFTKLSYHKAKLEGTISCKTLGEKIPIRNGEFSLFRPSKETGKRQIMYSFCFTGADSKNYFLHGYKVIYDDPNSSDLPEDMTTSFTRIYNGESVDGEVFGSGILHFKMIDLPAMLLSVNVSNADCLATKIKVTREVFHFCYGELRDTYLAPLSPIYFTEYENLVLNGKVTCDGQESQNFFFFSGVHDKDFPWGDGELFWDIALVIKNSDDTWSRYVLTDRIAENMKLDVEKGIYQYEGKICQITEGYQVFFNQMKKIPLPNHLKELDVKIDIKFTPRKFETVDLPFPLISNFKDCIPEQYKNDINELSAQLETLGLHLTPNKVLVKEGKITLIDRDESKDYIIQTDKTLGEAERSTFQNIKEPVTYYNYFCGINPDTDHVYVKINSDILRKHRKYYVIDKLEGCLGKIVNLIASLDLEIHDDTSEVLSKDRAKNFSMLDEDILEINNDHFPTAVFQRRIVSFTDSAGEVFLALEEDMDILNLSSINSDKVIKVAAIKNSHKFKALDTVLAQTEFFELLDEACNKSGKSKESFFIIIKPNFMFMYSKKDISTFTDPILVEYLVDQIYERGYRNIAVADARSSYGIFFKNREVKTVAKYIGLSEKNYRIIDLSEELVPYKFSGKLGDHHVNREWKNADFRISFAKNKTHSYAYYTLTIKNIYGALPYENKFLEYHNKRDIFTTTIEYIKHFPIHFGLIDASVSADGPFGIFADKNPNYTETIIGGSDIVAVDWIGSAKMGLDPTESGYMKEALKVFGKPEIKLTGNRCVYPDWVNVTDVVPALTFSLDKDYYFGNLFYSVFSNMDPFFEYKDKGFERKILRLLIDPLKTLFFQRIEEGKLDVDLNKKLYEFFNKQLNPGNRSNMIKIVFAIVGGIGIAGLSIFAIKKIRNK